METNHIQTLTAPPVLSKINTYQNWVDTGYQFFSNEGLEGIQVERIARALGLNKSGFYHYFGTRAVYLEVLMKHHQKQAEQMAADLSEMVDFDPDFFNILVQFKTPVLFQMQLVRNRHDNYLLEWFHKINNLLDPIVVPSWAAFIGLSQNHHLAKLYFEICRDLLYSRITSDNLTSEYVKIQHYEVRNLLREAQLSTDISATH